MNQKREILNEKYIKRQNDIQINMLEQEIDTKLLNGDIVELDQDGPALERERSEIDT